MGISQASDFDFDGGHARPIGGDALRYYGRSKSEHATLNYAHVVLRIRRMGRRWRF
jgi:hypothetical protein